MFEFALSTKMSIFDIIKYFQVLTYQKKTLTDCVVGMVLGWVVSIVVSLFLVCAAVSVEETCVEFSVLVVAEKKNKSVII